MGFDHIIFSIKSAVTIKLKSTDTLFIKLIVPIAA